MLIINLLIVILIIGYEEICFSIVVVFWIFLLMVFFVLLLFWIISVLMGWLDWLIVLFKCLWLNFLYFKEMSNILLILGWVYSLVIIESV